mmetsp:Transcript_16676/g.25278  ORF Transcript_16676/g.25278 Transcript_16676/m.25278 type:complete len:234 (-) Transcript_16676:1668-2369(-)
MSNINNSDKDEGYKRFLAFLASSPNQEKKAAAVAPPSMPMPMLNISESEDHEISAAAISLLSWEEEKNRDTVSESEGYIFEQSSHQLQRVNQDRSKALPLKSKLKLEPAPAEMKDDDDERRTRTRRPPNTRLTSLQRSSCTMTARRSIFIKNLGETAAVERPPRAGQHPDYPFENVVFQGGGAKARMRIDHIYHYHMTCYIFMISILLCLMQFAWMYVYSPAGSYLCGSNSSV